MILLYSHSTFTMDRQILKKMSHGNSEQTFSNSVLCQTVLCTLYSNCFLRIQLVTNFLCCCFLSFSRRSRSQPFGPQVYQEYKGHRNDSEHNQEVRPLNLKGQSLTHKPGQSERTSQYSGRYDNRQQYRDNRSHHHNNVSHRHDSRQGYHGDRRYQGQSEVTIREDRELNVDYQRSISDTAAVNSLEQSDQGPPRATVPPGRRRGRGRGRYRGQC